MSAVTKVADSELSVKAQNVAQRLVGRGALRILIKMGLEKQEIIQEIRRMLRERTQLQQMVMSF